MHKFLSSNIICNSGLRLKHLNRSLWTGFSSWDRKGDAHSSSTWSRSASFSRQTTRSLCRREGRIDQVPIHSTHKGCCIIFMSTNTHHGSRSTALPRSPSLTLERRKIITNVMSMNKPSLPSTQTECRCTQRQYYCTLEPTAPVSPFAPSSPE